MLVLLFRKCCCILWKHLSYNHHVSWILLLIVLITQQDNCDCKPRKWNHRIQRRFMWKQMDSTVDGFVDRVVTGARVMKSMIGDFMPPKQSSSNVMDYLPTETTRIKYIIRNPHTKETKVIRVRPSKKVVKLMAMTPKPLLADKPKAIHMNDTEHILDKTKSMQMKEPEYMIEHFKTMYMIDPEKLRQLEKEQELIAEGRIPIIGETKPIYMGYKAEKSKDLEHNFHDDIINGKIEEFKESWKPVYKMGDTPAGFTTSKPYMMSALHTSVVGDLMSVSQKPVYKSLISNYFPDEEPKKSHAYEVTEYTPEESVVHPYIHGYLRHQNPKALLPSPTATTTSFEQDVLFTTDTSNIITQAEDVSSSKTYQPEYRSQRGFLPSRGSSRLNVHTSTTTSDPSITSTTEEPNYPPIFLKKIRSHPKNNYNHKGQQRNKSATSTESTWIESNTTYTSHEAKHVPFHQHVTSISAPLLTESHDWLHDAEATYLSPEVSLIYDVPSTTEPPIPHEFTTQAILNKSNARKNVRLKNQHYSSYPDARHRTARQRGSVKYGDKLEI